MKTLSAEFSVGDPLPIEPINLFLDDRRYPFTTYHYYGPKIGIPPDQWTLVRSTESARELLKCGLVRTLSLDHDLGGEETGYDLIKWIHENNHWHNIEQIYVHSANPVGARNIKEFADRYFYNKTKLMLSRI